MPDPLADVSPGQPVRNIAARTNAWNAAARQLTRRAVDTDGTTKVSGLSETVISINLPNGNPIKAGGVVGLNKLIFKPKDKTLLQEIAFEADKPTQDNIDKRQFAILAEPANPGKGLYQAYLAGAFPAQVNLHQRRRHLRQGQGGTSPTSSRSNTSTGEYRVLWSPGETGLKWAVVTPNSLGPTAHPVIVGSAKTGVGFYDATTFEQNNTPIDVTTNLGVGMLGSGKSIIFAHLLEAARTAPTRI